MKIEYQVIDKTKYKKIISKHKGDNIEFVDCNICAKIDLEKIDELKFYNCNKRF